MSSGNSKDNQDGLVKSGSGEGPYDSGLSDSKVAAARRFLYEDDDDDIGESFPSHVLESPKPSSKKKFQSQGSTNLSGSGRFSTGASRRYSDNPNLSSSGRRSLNTFKAHGTHTVRNKTRNIVFALLTLVSVVILAVYFSESAKKDLVQNEQNKPNTSWTLPGTSGSSSSSGKKSKGINEKLHGPRLEQFTQVLTQRSELTSIEDLENPDSPQYQAMQWIATMDGAKLQPDDPLALQRYALAVLYYETAHVLNVEDPATTGHWNKPGNWMTDYGICQWDGVLCAGDDPDKPPTDHHGMVHTLELPLQDLRGTIPSELGALNMMYKLDLSHNGLAGSLPKSLAQCTGLRDLILRDNELEGQLPPDLLGKDMSNLRSLVLGGNKFKGTIPYQIEHLVELRTLDLADNQFSGSLPGLEDLTKLNQLILENNNFEGGLPESLGQLTALVVLNLSKNHFTGVIPEDLAELTRLEKLSLHDMNLRGSIPAVVLQKVTRLTELNLRENTLTGQIPTTVGHLKDLQSFWLSENHLEGTLPRQVGLMTDLKVLEFQGNKIEGSIPNLLSALLSLEHMNFARNNLTGTIPNDLGNLHRLKTLFLESNNFTGGIPTGLGKLESLKQARLYHNHFEGKMPTEVCYLATDEELIYLGADCNDDFKCSCCTKCF